MDEFKPLLFNVEAIRINDGARRLIAADKTKENAEAIINMAVMRRGVEEEIFVAVPIPL